MTLPENPPSGVFPAWAAAWQRRYLNPAFRRLAPYLPGFALLEHTGRRSGLTYTTPVNAFSSGSSMSFAMGHGRSDWVKNILAAGYADVRHRGRRLRLVNPRIVERGRGATGLPLPARVPGIRVEVLVADIGPADTGTSERPDH